MNLKFQFWNKDIIFVSAMIKIQLNQLIIMYFHPKKIIMF